MILWSEILKSQEMARMNNWKSIRDTQYKQREILQESQPKQNKKPSKPEQTEFKAIVDPIDEYHAYMERKKRLVMHWFRYYKMNKDPKKTDFILKQYNKIATMKQR